MRDATFTPLPDRKPLRAALSALTRRPEAELLPGLVEQATLHEADARAAGALALRIARGVRERTRDGGRSGMVQGLLQEFALSSHEGVALMCLAEALLRIPDAPTRDALIRDKISRGNWHAHLGQSPSLFVNAAAWGLLLTGKLVATHSEGGLSTTLRKAVARGGEPLIRRGVDMAMRMMGEQFVTGETIAEALSNAREREAQGFRYSYDMLGEAAMTSADARRYGQAYEAAIEAIGRAAQGRGPLDGPGISIKLSALHPRYVRAQVERVHGELYPVLRGLALLARQNGIGFNIDAEESDRLELSLDLLERLCHEPGLAGWNGIGFVIQAYGKRCPAVIDVLVDLARRSGHRLMVRLVKGAYWDSEIKRAQLDGQAGYPVYTRKAYTDVAYLACARRLLAAPDAVFPQFATHNAHTMAALYTMADPARWHPGQYEFQCLHGMGEPLYEQVVGTAPDRLGRPCRIYAPVGTHDTLLAYLVRRLLENGANTSFVNRIADENLPLEALVEDPVDTVRAMAQNDGAIGLPHPAIPLPTALFGTGRRNSLGRDLADDASLSVLAGEFDADRSADRLAAATEASGADGPTDPGQPPTAVLNPADHHDRVGWVTEASTAQIEAALSAARAAADAWAATPASERAARLDAAADRLEADTDRLIPLIVREAGKTCANAVAEIREAVDFLRFDAAQLRQHVDNTTHRPLGPVVCISPWNFPLAIFMGQVAAALAAGNTVLAKPAEQTPLIAAEAVAILHAAGIPQAAVQLLPGRGETVGAALVADARVQAVLFTGSTEVARLLQRGLSGRLTVSGQPVPLIAETGGQNAMVVDSSALAEQAVADIVSSAFDSAGQRCSAMRLLCIQNDAADRLIEMLLGAVAELRVGDPRQLATDVGPVIDADARALIEQHVDAMRRRGCRVWRWPGADDAPPLANHGTFVVPTVIEIDKVDDLGREVFGPVLHVLRYGRNDLPALLEQINATGYGLTQGVHTRIDETVAQVTGACKAGNLYVNRNVIGAVVGVQPFGGEGLSGTGPKAGGPLYLMRLLSERPAAAARLAVATSGHAIDPPQRSADAGPWPAPRREALAALRDWAQARGHATLALHCDQVLADTLVGPWFALPGPTGESNLYAVLPRETVLCITDPGPTSESDRLAQLAAVLAVGSQALWPAEAQGLRERLPAEVRTSIAIAADWTSAAIHFDAAIHHGNAESLLATARQLAARNGPIVSLCGLPAGSLQIPLERLVIERSISINTAAAGGNASLMTLA
jgi:RHH-type transcriptional regulator, proline utilization regulon repressor / proline dehydrogenase / delta 1-pyrroline-5-carboxylate dehydrogenase